MHRRSSYAGNGDLLVLREDRDESMVTSLLCHDDIKVCRVCVGWLSGNVGMVDSTPTLPVADMAEAVVFCEAAGLEVHRYDDGFAFVQLDDQSVFDLDLIPDMSPADNHAGCYIITAVSSTGTPVSSPPACTSPRSKTCRGGCTSSHSPIRAATTFASARTPPTRCKGGAMTHTASIGTDVEVRSRAVGAAAIAPSKPACSASRAAPKSASASDVSAGWATVSGR